MMEHAARNRRGRGHRVTRRGTLNTSFQISGSVQVNTHMPARIESGGILGEQMLQVAVRRRVSIEPELNRAIINLVGVVVCDFYKIIPIEEDRCIDIADQRARLTEASSVI